MKTEPRHGWAVTTAWRNKPKKRFFWGKKFTTRTEAITDAVEFWYNRLLGTHSRENLWRRMKREGFRCERVVLMTLKDDNQREIAASVADEALRNLDCASNILCNYAQMTKLPAEDRKYFKRKSREYDDVHKRLRTKLRT